MAFPCRRIRRFFAIFAATNNNGMRFALQLLPLPLVFSLSAMGQTTATVIDMETHVPMRGVEVVVNGSYDGKVATNYTGAFAVDGKVNDITLIKRGYETRVLKAEELTDTIEMLPSYKRIDEVIVYGKMPGRHMPVVGMIKKDIKAMPKPSDAAVASGDFLAWLKVFEKGYVSKKKRRERMKAIENY